MPLAGHLAICCALARAPKLPVRAWLSAVALKQAGGTAERPGSAQGWGKAGFAGVGDVIRGAEQGRIALCGTEQGKNIQTLWSSSGAKHSLLSTVRALLPWTPKHKHRMILGFLSGPSLLIASLLGRLQQNFPGTSPKNRSSSLTPSVAFPCFFCL